MLNIFVDADASPVKEEVYRVAKRYGLQVVVVANSRIAVPAGGGVRLQVVEGGFDAADDWIVEHAGRDDIVISGDIPLAARCLARGAVVIGPGGRPFTEDGIGDALATRGLLAELRLTGDVRGGPLPFTGKDRSRFLQKLDEAVHAIRRRAR